MMSRKFVSSNDLASLDNLPQKHKKSSSFSNSQFPDMSSEIRRHRKTKSSDSKKSLVQGGARNSMSFSEDVISATTPGRSTTTMTTQLSNQRMSLFAQMYNNGTQVEPFQIKRQSTQSSIETRAVVEVKTPPASQQSSNISKVLLVFTLVILILSGFFMTPK